MKSNKFRLLFLLVTLSLPAYSQHTVTQLYGITVEAHAWNTKDTVDRYLQKHIGENCFTSKIVVLGRTDSSLIYFEQTNDQDNESCWWNIKEITRTKRENYLFTQENDGNDSLCLQKLKEQLKLHPLKKIKMEVNKEGMGWVAKVYVPQFKKEFTWYYDIIGKHYFTCSWRVVVGEGKSKINSLSCE